MRDLLHGLQLPRAPSPGPTPTAASASSSTTDDVDPDADRPVPRSRRVLRRRAPGGGLPADLRPPPGGRPADGSITRDRLGVGLSPADAAALEHALRIAEAWSGRVVAVCVGPRSVEPGAPRGGRSRCRRRPGPARRRGRRPPLRRRAGRRRAAAGPHAGSPPSRPFGRPDLVLCGDRSVDRGTGALPAYLAHELGAAQALGLVALGTAGCGAGERSLLVERRLDGGWRERLRVPLPAVCSVEAAGVRLRRASLAGALDAADGADPRRPVTGGGRRRRSRAAPADVHIGAPRPFRPAPGSSRPRRRRSAAAPSVPDRGPGGPRPPDGGPSGRRRRGGRRAPGLPGPSRLPRGHGHRSTARTTPGSGDGRDPAGRRRPGRRWPIWPRAGAVLVVPVGATEQHGPHLPVTTDADIAVAVVEAAAAADPLLVVAPVVAYGSQRRARRLRRHPLHRPGGDRGAPGRARPLGRRRLRPRGPGLHPRRQRRRLWPGPSRRLADEGRPVTGWWPRWDGRPPRRSHRDVADAGHRPRSGPPRRAVPGDTRTLDELLPLLRGRRRPVGQRHRGPRGPDGRRGRRGPPAAPGGGGRPGRRRRRPPIRRPPRRIEVDRAGSEVRDE